MDWAPVSGLRRFCGSPPGTADRLLPRWLFLRALGLIYFSAFYSLIFQIRGLIGPRGILPANQYLQAVAQHFGLLRFWFSPSLLWISSDSPMLLALCWTGMLAAVLLTSNLWPRAMLLICFVCFLSFVSAAQDFSGYQSDGMLLEAGFIALFFAPPGLRPGLGASHPPSRISLFLLQWEWFRIYFESGIVKLASGDPQWRNLTAMDEYYQNGPLPTWIGWYVQHWPHWFHAFSVYATFALELGLVWMLFLPRRWRILCFCIVTPWQIAIILTANYTFLNYLVLVLGFLLLDDRFLLGLVPLRFSIGRFWIERWRTERWRTEEASRAEPALPIDQSQPNEPEPEPAPSWRNRIRQQCDMLKLFATATVLSWIFYAATVQLFWMFLPPTLFPSAPVAALEPARIANRYGLFAVMTRGRYEIEFQGSQDGQTWLSYPFRYKPQDPSEPPRIYAPYQPRFDWNLWFASLGSWRENLFVLNTEERLLENDPDVLALFARNPFPDAPPRQVRAVLWQYWFTSVKEKREKGTWWRRELLGPYAPTIEVKPDGGFGAVEIPQELPLQQ
jgi:hypothetical protein